MFVRYNVYSFIGLNFVFVVLRIVNNAKVLYEVWKRAGSDETDAKYFGNSLHEPVFECWRYLNNRYSSSSCVASN